MIGAKDLAHISRHQTLSADKNSKVIELAQGSIYKLGHICTISG
jgi:hypothetical protein